LRKLAKEYERYNDVDGSEGQCCCSWENIEGSNYIFRFDLYFILNLPRFFTAYLAWRDERKFGNYSRTRMITMVIESILSFFGIIGYVFKQALGNDKAWGKDEYVYSLVGLSLVIFIFLVDYHFCKVI
jgi:hypothetical protein